MAELFLITGGARSGKSTFAEHKALEIVQESDPSSQAAYLATGLPLDAEFSERIARHRGERSGQFTTFEEPRNLAGGVADALREHQVVLVECLTTWLGNVFHYEKGDARVQIAMDMISELLSLIKRHTECRLIVVTNELGLGLVPADPDSRLFRDLQGRLNRQLAAVACEVYMVLSGIPLKIK